MNVKFENPKKYRAPSPILPATATNLKGDWLAGNAGDDILVAGADSDVLTGGGGADLLIAGAGDDFILGDAEYTAQFITEADPRYSLNGINRYHSTTGTFDWNVVQDSSGTWIFQQAAGAIEPADSGNDVIYAGDGADHVWAGAGSDVVYGGAGGDALNGGDGQDILMGGTGDDRVRWRIRAAAINGSQAANDESAQVWRVAA